MTGRRLWLIALVWVLTVSGASVLAWTVISAAGARVGPTALVVVATPDPGVPTPGMGSPTGTWSGKGGRLTASCAGSSISLGSAVPDVGYWVRVHDRGPTALRVDFESTDPDDYSEVRMTATCVNGSPAFRRE